MLDINTKVGDVIQDHVLNWYVVTNKVGWVLTISELSESYLRDTGVEHSILRADRRDYHNTKLIYKLS